MHGTLLFPRTRMVATHQCKTRPQTAGRLCRKSSEILIIGIQLYWPVRWLVPADGSRLILYILAYIVLAGVALYVWHKDPPVEHLSEPSRANELWQLLGQS